LLYTESVKAEKNGKQKKKLDEDEIQGIKMKEELERRENEMKTFLVK
jgi:hypothetical protein